MRDWRVEVIYRRRAALVVAHALIDCLHVREIRAVKSVAQNPWRKIRGRARLFALEFDAPEVIHADGIEIAMTGQPVPT